MADRELMERGADARVQIRPLYTIFEEKGVVKVRMEMPGVSKENLSVSIENRELRVIGKRSADETEGTFIIRERRAGDYANVFTLDDTIDQNRIDASLEKGMLTITLHLKEEVKPKRIEIKAS
jgi:HSP20 family protein